MSWSYKSILTLNLFFHHAIYQDITCTPRLHRLTNQATHWPWLDRRGRPPLAPVYLTITTWTGRPLPPLQCRSCLPRVWSRTWLSTQADLGTSGTEMRSQSDQALPGRSVQGQHRIQFFLDWVAVDRLCPCNYLRLKENLLLNVIDCPERTSLSN